MTVTLRRSYPTSDEAARIAAAVGADNPDFVRVTTEGRELRVEVRAPSPASARATLDDLVACLQVAERTSRAARSEPASGAP